MIKLFQKYLFFVIVFALFLVLIFALGLFLRNNKKSNYAFYGTLMDLKNNEIFALALIIMNYLLLTYFLIFKIKFNIPFAIISVMLIIISYLLVLKPGKLCINLVINLVNIAIIYLANLVDTLRIDNTNNIYFFLQIAVNLFGLFFYMFTSLKFVKDIRKVKNEKESN